MKNILLKLNLFLNIMMPLWFIQTKDIDLNVYDTFCGLLTLSGKMFYIIIDMLFKRNFVKQCVIKVVFNQIC